MSISTFSDCEEWAGAPLFATPWPRPPGKSSFLGYRGFSSWAALKRGPLILVSLLHFTKRVSGPEATEKMSHLAISKSSVLPTRLSGSSKPGVFEMPRQCLYNKE